MVIKKCVDVIVGLQFGSEGKGKVAAFLADYYRAAVRVGAPNAGHTIHHNGQEYKMRTIPCAWVNPDAKLYIGAGGLINLEVLAKELMMIQKVDPSINHRLRIDVNCGVVTQKDIDAEEKAKMYEGIGSTCEGVGEATARKVLRRESLVAKDVVELSPFMTNVAMELNGMIDMERPIMIEGTQGFGLSINHGYYPYTTSRDVLASSMLSECGLSPHVVRNVIGVMRTYPIRVHGNSGPMGAEELTWEQVSQESGLPNLIERTTVTKRVRRVSRMNWDMLEAACQANRPDHIALMFADYLGAENLGVRDFTLLSRKAHAFIDEVEKRCNVPVTYISTGPNPADMIVRPYGELPMSPQ